MRRLGKPQPKKKAFLLLLFAARRSTALVSNKILSRAFDPRLTVSIGMEEYSNGRFAFAASMGSYSASRGFLEPTRMSSSVCQPKGIWQRYLEPYLESPKCCYLIIVERVYLWSPDLDKSSSTLEVQGYWASCFPANVWASQNMRRFSCLRAQWSSLLCSFEVPACKGRSRKFFGLRLRLANPQLA